MSNLPPYNITFTPSSGNTLSSSDISTTISNYGGFKQARYFFIQLETTNTPMNYAEIEIYDENGTNIASNGTSGVSYAQSSLYTPGDGTQHIASYAFNGTTDADEDFQHTYFYSGLREWLGVDLGSNKKIAGIRLYGRQHSNYAVGGTSYARTAPFRIFLYTASEYTGTFINGGTGPLDYYSYHLHTNDATKNETNNNQQVFYYGIIATGANTTNYSEVDSVKSIVFASPKYIFNNTSGSISSSNVNTTLNGYTGLFTAILGPDVNYIQTNGFQDKNVTDISFANATLLQAETFKDCTQLVSVTIPNTISRVQWNVFDSCSRLSKAKIHKYRSNGTEVEYAIGFNSNDGQQVFQGCTNLAVTIVSYDKLDNIGIGGTNDIITSNSYASDNITIHYEIPDGTTTIPTNAFKLDIEKYNKTISIPNGVTTIGNAAFYHAGIIGQVVLPNSVTTMVASNNFEGNPLMTSFIFPTNASFTSIPGWCFKNCYALTSINIPNSVTSIGRHAFYGCTSLDEVTLHKYPGDDTSNISISLGGVTGSHLSGNVYTTDVFDGMKPDATFTIFSNEIMDINTDIIPVRYVFYERDLTTVQAEGSMVEFEVWDENNTKISYTLNPTVLFSSKWEGSSTNYQHSNINDGDTADAVGEWYSRIANQTVYDVFGTESGTYKKAFIGYDFGSPKKISKIVLTACNQTDTYNHENVLAGSSTDRTNDRNGYNLYFTNNVITVDNTDSTAYTPDYYTCVDPTQPYVKLNSYDYTTFEDATNNDTINNDFYTTLISQFNYRYQIIDGTTSIAANAFKDRTDLLSVDISNSVTEIGTSAFEGTSNMTSCTLPINASFTTIPEKCFKNSGLTSISIPNSVTSIGESAFEFSPNIYQYVFIEGVAKRLELAEIEIYDDNGTRISQNGSWNMNETPGNNQGEMTTTYGDAFYFNGVYDQTQNTDWNPKNILDGIIPSSDIYKDQGVIEHHLYPRAYQHELFATSISRGSNIPYCVIKFNQPRQIGKIVIHCRRNSAYNNVAGSENSSNHNIYLANSYDVSMATRPSNWDTTRSTPTIPWISGTNYKSILHSNSDVSWTGTSTNYQYSKEYDFSDVNGLASCTFTATSSLETIGASCFKNSGLTSIANPNSVTSIGTFAFEGTSNMTSCTLPTNTSFTTISESCFKNSGLNSITIPNNVDLIVVSAFEGTSSMTSCTLPINASFTTIPNWTFYYSGLTSIAIPDSVTSIGTSVFEGTSSMTSCTFTANSSLETIGTTCFKNSGLTSVTIPDSVTSIGTFAFEGTSSMTSCTLPSNNASFTTISESCFKNSGLNSINIPDSVTLIVVSAFQGTSSMTSCILPINPSFTTIPNWTFYYSGLTSIAIPDSVTSIGTSVFEGTSSMTSCTFTANSSLETIGTTCFKNSGLTSISIPNSVTDISNSAFKDCTSLTGFTLPNNPNFTIIPENCFNNSLNWTSIQSIPQSVTSISTGAFTCENNLDNTAYLKIPSTYHEFIILYYVSDATARFATDKGLVLLYNHFDSYKFTNSSNAVFQYDDSGTSNNQIDFDEYKIHDISLQYFRKGIVNESTFGLNYTQLSNTMQVPYDNYPYAVAGDIGYKWSYGDIGRRIAPYYTIYNNNRSNVKLLPGWKRLGLLVIGGGGGGGSGGVWDGNDTYMGAGSGGGSGGIGLGLLNRSEFSVLNEINIVRGNGGLGGNSHGYTSKANGRKGGYGYHTYVTNADDNTELIKATGGGGGNGGHGQTDSGYWGWHGAGVKGHHWTETYDYTTTTVNPHRWQGGHEGTVIYGNNVNVPTNGVGVSDHGEWADGTEGGPNPIRDADNGYGRYTGCQGGKITKYVNIFSSGNTYGNGGNGGNEGPNAGSSGSSGVVVVIQYFS